jgi:hypothetical protein
MRATTQGFVRKVGMARKRKNSTSKVVQPPPAEDIAIDPNIALGKEEWDEDDVKPEEAEVEAEEGEFGDMADFNSNSDEDEDIAGELNEDDEEDEDGVSESEDGEVDEDDITEGIDDESYGGANGASGEEGEEEGEEGDDDEDDEDDGEEVYLITFSFLFLLFICL